MDVCGPAFGREGVGLIVVGYPIEGLTITLLAFSIALNIHLNGLTIHVRYRTEMCREFA